MGGFETQRAFHIAQEHPKRTSDKEVMVVRSWRTQPENSVIRTSRGLLFSVIFGHNLSSSCIKLYMGGFKTQRAFHRIQEHPKRTSDEQVMAVRSWRTQPENPVRRTSRGLLFSVIFRHNLGSSCWENNTIPYLQDL